MPVTPSSFEKRLDQHEGLDTPGCELRLCSSSGYGRTLSGYFLQDGLGISCYTHYTGRSMCFQTFKTYHFSGSDSASGRQEDGTHFFPPHGTFTTKHIPTIPFLIHLNRTEALFTLGKTGMAGLLRAWLGGGLERLSASFPASSVFNL